MHKLKMGIIGGGKGAFIGAVHRMAATLDGRAELVAGCMSSDPARARESGRESPWNLADDRNYGTWQEMLERELARPVGTDASARIDFVSIVTPNHAHAPIAGAFARAGFHVVCDKPLCMNTAEARELAAAQKQGGGIFAVTYNYSGYPMVKQARHMVMGGASGELGEIRKVIVEYNQGWLASQLEQSGQKQADWRTDPKRAGIGGAIGDIGSHAEHLLRYITGLDITHICADLTSFVPGRQLDDDANLLLRLSNGARGILTCSQVCIGGENDLRIRIWGTKAGLEWRQEEPNALCFRIDGKPEQVLRRGNAYLCPAAQAATRIPSGHPEAFLEAFANVYRGAFEAIAAASGESRGASGAKSGGLGGSPSAAAPVLDYPTLEDGARGVHFIEKTVESALSDRKWTTAMFS
jgi:predicted dehydrogenase